MREGDGRQAREREGKEERNRGVRGEGGREGGRRGVSSLCVLMYNVHVCTYL